ncbi:electron transfer flavoprotein subunit beta/FixA family protein [Haloferax sp. ATB1]|uniref:electron transfer flavoprotein subunit beta/FixA family protein n=1 Tax=Haloferax sp. ATB1 TaxID=1508454 RepID=UPI0005B22B5F|nr:electron transfer flavoprotein subunit beta/FixA family protein [Haloferax sp. ATB1]
MRVLVAVKQVTEVADDFEISGTSVEQQYLEYDLNEWDDYAIEEAVQLSESGIADEVVSVTIGPERTEETIRTGLAKGVDRAIRVWDDTLAEKDLPNVRTKANILAAVVEQEEPDLILTGVQANDDGFGATGVALADEISSEWASVVTELNLDLEDEVARVHRELEGGIEELLEVELPAVLTIQTGINEPRYASLRGIRQASRKELVHQTLDDLGVESDTEDSLRLVSMNEPESESEAQYFDGSTEEQANELAGVLEEKGVVGE